MPPIWASGSACCSASGTSAWGPSGTWTPFAAAATGRSDTWPLNERIEALLQGKGTLPVFRPDQVDPADLLINSFNGTPEIAQEIHRLADVVALAGLTLQASLGERRGD
jgi:hypothetical protein